MRGENNFVRLNSDLLEQFPGVPVTEHAVGREIICRLHEVSFGSGRFARTTHPALGISNNPRLRIQQTGLY